MPPYLLFCEIIVLLPVPPSVPGAVPSATRSRHEKYTEDQNRPNFVDVSVNQIHFSRHPYKTCF